MRNNESLNHLFVSILYIAGKNVCVSVSKGNAATGENNEMSDELKPCPHCGQTFKSLLGLKYHLRK
jgi:hypothetical protein